jgi:hypothetical protein
MSVNGQVTTPFLPVVTDSFGVEKTADADPMECFALFPRDEAKGSLHPSKTQDVTGRSKSGRKGYTRRGCRCELN